MSSPDPIMQKWQERLIAAGYSLAPYGADGFGGRVTQQAILDFQASHGLATTGQFDEPTRKALNPQPDYSTGRSFAALVINLILNQALKGTGINMDFAKISKAIAGGITAAIATTGTMAVVYLQLPPDAQTHFPSFVYSVLPWINEGIGFLVGFCGVYFAPANKTS